MSDFKISEKIDAVVHCPEASLIEAPPPPHSAKVELMRSCNFRCAYCHHARMSVASGEMSIGLYKRIVDELLQLGVKEIAPFFYGESFLSPRLPEAVRYAHERGCHYIFLTTNGSAASEGMVKDCMRSGLNSLKFSLNYANAHQFRDMTGVPASAFNRIKHNIMAARRVRDAGRFDCGLYASYIRYDDKQDERMKPLLAELGPYLDEVYALPMYGRPSTLTDMKLTGGNQGRADNPVPPLPCWALFREVHVNYDGTVCACCFNVGDQFVMGDLKAQPFMDVWHGEKFKALRRAHLAKCITGTPCEGCVK